MADNLIFEDSTVSNRSIEAFCSAFDQLPDFPLGWTCALDGNSGDVLYFFSLEFMRAWKHRDVFLKIVKQKWQKANFKIVEEKELPENFYPQIVFDSYCLRLKYIKP